MGGFFLKEVIEKEGEEEERKKRVRVRDGKRKALNPGQRKTKRGRCREIARR